MPSINPGPATQQTANLQNVLGIRLTDAQIANPAADILSDLTRIYQSQNGSLYQSNGTALNILLMNSSLGGEFSYMDNFTRTDTAGGTLGPVTQASGDGGTRAFPGNWIFVNGDANAGQITSNRYTSVSPQNSYATQTLAGQKIRRVSAKIDWKGASIPGGAVSGATIIISPNTTNWTNQAVHLQVNPYYIELDKLIPTSTVVRIAGGNPAGFYPGTTPVALNTTVRVDCAFDDFGNFLITADPGRTAGIQTLTGNDPYLATCLGPSLLLQCIQGGTGYTVEWSEVRIGFRPLSGT